MIFANATYLIVANIDSVTCDGRYKTYTHGYRDFLSCRAFTWLVSDNVMIADQSFPGISFLLFLSPGLVWGPCWRIFVVRVVIFTVGFHDSTNERRMGPIDHETSHADICQHFLLCFLFLLIDNCCIVNCKLFKI